MNSEEELTMIHETSGLIPTWALPALNEVPFRVYISINRGLNSWGRGGGGGRLALVVVIHETNVNTKYWRHIAPELAFPHDLMQFYRENGSGTLWLLCADEV